MPKDAGFELALLRGCLEALGKLAQKIGKIVKKQNKKNLIFSIFGKL